MIAWMSRPSTIDWMSILSTIAWMSTLSTIAWMSTCCTTPSTSTAATTTGATPSAMACTITLAGSSRVPINPCRGDPDPPFGRLSRAMCGDETLERLGHAFDEKLRFGDCRGVERDANVEPVVDAVTRDVDQGPHPRTEREALLDDCATDLTYAANARQRGGYEVDRAGLGAHGRSEEAGRQMADRRREHFRDM